MAFLFLSFSVETPAWIGRTPACENRLRSCPAVRARRRLHEAGGAYHVIDAGPEAEHQKHDHAPGTRSKPAVEQPAQNAARSDPGHELRRHAESAAHRRRFRGRPLRGLVPSGSGGPLLIELSFK